MYNTHKLMRHILSSDSSLRAKSDAQLVETYKLTENQLIIAEFYVRYFGFYNLVARRFNGVSDSDKASIIMEKILLSIKYWNESNTASFATYCCSCIRSGLYEYVYRGVGRLDTRDKQYCVSSEHIENEDGDCISNELAATEEKYDKIDLMMSLKGYGLNDKELTICEVLVESPNTQICELSDMVSCHRHTVRKAREHIQNVLKYMYKDI